MATTTSPSTIVCAFDSVSDAQAAIQDLVQAGVSRNEISLVAHDQGGQHAAGVNTDDVTKTTDGTTVGENVAAGTGIGALGGLLIGLGALAIPGIGPVVAAGPLAAALGGALSGAAGGGLIGTLKDAGVPDDDAQFYGEHLRRGGALLTIHGSGSQDDTIHDILRDHDAIEVGEREQEFRQGGWSGFDANAGPYTGGKPTTGRIAPETRTATNLQGERTLPVVEEELVVGKREVQRGGIRVYSRITERPVEEQVSLRDETIRVDRRPVNREATEADFRNDQVIEVTETDEEAVVSKKARVVEEVTLGKDVSQRTETVSDTVRRTDVEVEQISGKQTGSTGAVDFRDDFQTRYGSVRGASYETYAPAYQYGYKMAGDPRYKGQNYSAVESNLRRDYETSNPGGTWESMKDAVRHGWEKVTGQR